jgi:hypothetical protein
VHQFAVAHVDQFLPPIGVSRTWCWDTARARLIPIGYQQRGYVRVVRNRDPDVPVAVQL